MRFSVEPSDPASVLSSMSKLPKEKDDERRGHGGIPLTYPLLNVSHIVRVEGPMEKIASLVFRIVFSAACGAKRAVLKRDRKGRGSTPKLSRLVRDLFKERGDR